MPTSRQIQGEVYELLAGSSLASLISGRIYREGTRPSDSSLEDAVIVFTTGNAEQIEEGIVTINIFVPDIDPYDNGILVEDTARTEEIEIAANDWVESIGAGGYYLFSLYSQISTMESYERKEHIVAVQLEYRYFNQ